MCRQIRDSPCASNEKEDDPVRLKMLLAERERQLADQEYLIKLLTRIPKPMSQTPLATEVVGLSSARRRADWRRPLRTATGRLHAT